MVQKPIKKLPEHSSTHIPEAYHGKEESRHILYFVIGPLIKDQTTFTTIAIGLSFVNNGKKINKINLFCHNTFTKRHL